MANDIDKTSPHYKGDFGSIYEVNKKFPTGGVAGDFVVIEGWAHYWNADRATWCVNAERDSYWDELITNIIEKFKLIRGATYMGVASLDTLPAKVIGAKMYYFATVAGTYKNFGDLVVPQGINVLYSENGSSWVNTTLLEVAQELGVSTKKVVSQKALNDALNLKANQSSVNEALAKKADKESVVQESGDAEDKVMSQKAVSDKLSDLSTEVLTEVLTKGNIDIDINLAILTKKLILTDFGVEISSKDYLTSDYIYLGERGDFLVDIQTGNVSVTQYLAVSFFDKDKTFIKDVAIQYNGADIKKRVKNADIRYCRVTLLKSLIENCKLRIQNYQISDASTQNKEYLLGGLWNRTNLVLKEVVGYSILNGNLESEGQQNFKVCIVPVKKGNIYYFYNNNNGKAEAHTANYAITNYLLNENTGTILSTGNANSVAIEEDDVFLYVNYKKDSEAMISLSEQTDFIKADNDIYLKVNELENSIESANVELVKKLDKEAISQELGTADDKVVSQKVVNGINDGLINLIGVSQSETIKELSGEEITLGSISSNDGSNYENDKYARTDYIDITSFDSIHISSSVENYLTTQRAILALYDNEKNFIATPIKGINNGLTYDETITLSDYDSVSYMRIGLNSKTERPNIELIKFASKGKIEILQAKVNEHDVSINELIAKSSTSQTEFAKHPIAKDISDDSVVISDVYDNSTITDGTLYPVLKDDKLNGEVSDLYRYSIPVKPNDSGYPLGYGVKTINSL